MTVQTVQFQIRYNIRKCSIHEVLLWRKLVTITQAPGNSFNIQQTCISIQNIMKRNGLTYLEYLQNMRSHRHFQSGPIVRCWELQLIIVFMDAEMVGAPLLVFPLSSWDCLQTWEEDEEEYWGPRYYSCHSDCSYSRDTTGEVWCVDLRLRLFIKISLLSRVSQS